MLGRSGVSVLSGLGTEAITTTAHGVDQVRSPQLAAQSRDVNINRSLQDDGTAANHRGHQLCAGECVARFQEQLFQQAILGRRQVKDLVIHEGPALRAIEFHVKVFNEFNEGFTSGRPLVASPFRAE